MTKSTTKKDNLVKFINEYLLLEFDGDDGNIGFGNTSFSLIGTLVEPFADVAKTAKALTTSVYDNAKILTRLGIGNILSLIPGVLTPYDTILSDIQSNEKNIQEKYSDVFNRTNSVFKTSEFKFVGLMLNPSLFMSTKALAFVKGQSPKVKEEFLKFVSEAKGVGKALVALASFLGVGHVLSKELRKKAKEEKLDKEKRLKIAQSLNLRFELVKKDLLESIKKEISKIENPLITISDAGSLDDLESKFGKKFKVPDEIRNDKEKQKEALEVLFKTIKDDSLNKLLKLSKEYSDIPEIEKMFKESFEKINKMKKK